MMKETADLYAQEHTNFRGDCKSIDPPAQWSDYNDLIVRAKKITTCCLPLHCDCLFVGTLGGITYPIDTGFDGMSPEVLSWSRARA